MNTVLLGVDGGSGLEGRTDETVVTIPTVGGDPEASASPRVASRTKLRCYSVICNCFPVNAPEKDFRT